MNLSAITHIIFGPIFDTNLIERFKGDFAEIPNDTRLIAVDGGADMCRLTGLVPDEYFGDNDSLSREGLAYLQNQNVEMKVFESEKDFSDFGAAIKSIAQKEEASGDDAKVLVVGMSGGRLDQQLAVFGEASLSELSRVAFYGENEYIELLNATRGEVKTKIKGEQLFSLLSLSPHSIVCINQAKWELQSFELKFLSSRGLSNIGPAEIVIEVGSCLVIVNRARR